MRNKLVGALQSDDKDEGRKYVSSAYMFLFGVSLIIIVVIVVLSQFVNWNTVFNIDTDVLESDVLRKALTILLVSIILQFVLRLITSVLYALQKAFIPSLLNLLTNVIMLLYASFAINMKYVTEIEKTYEKVWNIKLRGCDDVVLLSYTYRQAFLRRIE